MKTESFFETRDRLRQHYGRRPEGPQERGLEYTANTTREMLQGALSTKYANSYTYVWVRDFDDSWVIYEVEAKVGETYEITTWRESYTIEANGSVDFPDSTDRQQVQATTQWMPVQAARAFKTEVAGRTLITAPASVLLEKAAAPNPYFLNVAGRFVGGEKPNRNRALWTLDDLQLGEPTVRNGPLNWLHEDRHIVGSLTGSTLVQAREVAGSVGDEMLEPYIAASAAVWRWIWPEEAAVIEQASEAQKLWYSMECISETVVCSGIQGCETEVAYMDYLKGDGVCDHVAQRASDRRFKNPTFLGGAVIVPPVRPGWADANLELMQAAEKFTEAAFEQAGRPDVQDREWTALMAEVLRYANG